ncbi:hypothetical protein C3B47_14485 [Flavobacterium columnare]|uniref:hypothetical protein n=1 Tax=Flavobacterium columnare TaxID=996 RepID=UPI0018963F88|nr:hypothetical protein [Flavobacterium columnare]MBF6654060.1 hypothetical protein [Flavobacterium columnare]MBF6657386.1 hypothetical protein [Flavobacterium columnare]
MFFKPNYNKELIKELKHLDDILLFLLENKKDGVGYTTLTEHIYNISILPEGKESFENIEDFFKNATFGETNTETALRVTDTVKHLIDTNYVLDEGRKLYITFNGILKIKDGFVDSYKTEINDKEFQKRMSLWMIILTALIFLMSFLTIIYYAVDLYLKFNATPTPPICNNP